ncbi:cation transporter [Tessaracoccus sp. HDW20]|uniref:cation transporter n=1 Tax=Tessaracoccus coleopterorum TaxID=2714950 RepID=UPI001E34B620|nr:heavy-metal-associated domain-containing protein [Tessaracoccus coleopterorum]NHB84964.1 cation transporter [Tessaracoccus coleopterorum]
MKNQTTVLEVGGLHWATSEPVIEKTLRERPGVLAVQASAVSQTATVTYDPDTTSVAQLVGWVNECGYHCAGQSVPDHMCHPMSEPAPTDAHTGHDAPRGRPGTTPMQGKWRMMMTPMPGTPVTGAMRMRLTAPRRR